MSNVGTWSTIASDNNKPAPNGWPENMAPSEVNNSARENMAAIKRMTLDFPYVSLGGTVTYVDKETVSIADDSLDTNYARYYTVGRRVKVKQSVGDYYGTVTESTYASGTSTIKLAMDDGALPTQGTLDDVMVGLAYVDTSALVGPNMLGIVLPYTADTDNIPFGFGLADGEPFDPNLYKDLADLYFTGMDTNGLPTYKYGREAVSGVYWPKKPDVRGYFPRFLDLGIGRDSESSREVGSTQDDAIRNIIGTVGQITSHADQRASGALSCTIGDDDGVKGVGRGWNRNTLHFDASKTVPTASENRPKNIAFPGLLVMHGGYATAGQLTPDNLVAAMISALNIDIVRITSHGDNNTATLSKTFNEISASYNAGNVLALYDNVSHIFYSKVTQPFMGVADEPFVFESSTWVSRTTNDYLTETRNVCTLASTGGDNRTATLVTQNVSLATYDYVTEQIGEINAMLDIINGTAV